jgi:hypothetical protein
MSETRAGLTVAAQIHGYDPEAGLHQLRAQEPVFSTKIPNPWRTEDEWAGPGIVIGDSPAIDFEVLGRCIFNRGTGRRIDGRG